MRVQFATMLILVALILITTIQFAWCADTRPIVKSFWQPDAAVWGDGREVDPPSVQKPPHGFRNDYRMTVPADGWYELYFIGAGPGMTTDVFVDGKPAWYYSGTDKDSKAGNLWLSAGEHVIRVQRLGRNGFPLKTFDQLELRPSGNRLNATISAKKTLVDVVRCGEPLKIEVTSGGIEQDAVYEIWSTELLKEASAPVKVAELKVAKGDPINTKIIEISCPSEGAFELHAEVERKSLTSSEFAIGQYAVVDVKKSSVGSGEKELVHDIDCVNQTDFGKTIGENVFVECNGPTRIAETANAKYRESHDCTPPYAPIPATSTEEPVSFSGFSYRVAIDRPQEPHLIEVDYPDDARRSVTITLNGLDEQGNLYKKNNYGYSGKSYETGGMFPITQTIQHHRAVVWPATNSLLIGVLSQSPGHRAAAIRIRVYRFKDGQLPAAPQVDEGGRSFVHWYEEANSWRQFVGVNDIRQPVVRDAIGFQRWAQLLRYYGANGISAMGMGYQEALYRTTQAHGYAPMEYDACRLMTLVCEKYGLKYLPEVYPAQWYLESKVYPEIASSEQDTFAWNCQGGKLGSGYAPCAVNPLHPAVQDTWINIIGELADKLRDSPAFAGVTIRNDTWGFRGEFMFAGLNWGYGDWIIREFEKAAKVIVPGGPSDTSTLDLPAGQRFLKRYEFLTSPPMLTRWIDWRKARLLDYHQRILARMRGDRTDLMFGMSGAFDADPVYALPKSIIERAIGCGIDIEQRASMDGLPVIPDSRYGTRHTTENDQATYDRFFDQENVRSGMGIPRAFAAYMNYQELARYWPLEKLGAGIPKGEQKPYYCSAVLAAGRHFLEKYAVVLAEQDSSLLRDGGNTDIFGDPEILGPWLAEYRALPAVAFERHPNAVDPVAVWSRQIDDSSTATPGYYFYVVNREQYPIKVEIKLKNASSLVRLGRRQTIDAGTLVIQLQPYELQSFRASAGAAISDVVTQIPADQKKQVEDELVYAAQVSQRLDGAFSSAVAPDDKTQFRQLLSKASESLNAGHVWRARVTLRSAPMMRVYSKVDRLPARQIATSFPSLLSPIMKNGHWVLLEPMLTAREISAMNSQDNSSRLVESSQYNSEWNGSHVWSTDKDSQSIHFSVPADGKYSIHLGVITRSEGKTQITLDNQPIGEPNIELKPSQPDRVIFPPIMLKSETHTLSIRHENGIGVYGLKVLPVLRPLPDTNWSVCGPFPSFLKENVKDDFIPVSKGFQTSYPPEMDQSFDSVFTTSKGAKLKWKLPMGEPRSMISDLGVDMSCRTLSPSYEINYAMTFLHSDREQSLLLYLAPQWWANVYLNGQRLVSNIDPAMRAKYDADFTTWYPRFFTVLNVKKGSNTLLIKQHGGSGGSGFAAFVTDTPDIQFTPAPTTDLKAQK